MRTRVVVVLVLVFAAACGYGGADGQDDDASPDAPASTDGNVNDANDGCVVDISYTPTKPIAGDDTRVRLKALVTGAFGVQSYTWTVRRGATVIPTAPAQPDNSEATFLADLPATYDVRLDVEVPSSLFCPQGSEMVEVKIPGAGEAEFRFHIVAPVPASPADPFYPPVDERVIVEGGPSDGVDDFILAEGQLVDGFVRANGSPISAYLKFMPITSHDAAVESFSDGAGAYTVFLRNEPHDVLVIPTSASFAPRIVTWAPGQPSLDVDGGDVITGVVRDQANALLAGATVQLTIAGVPTTFATTNASGAFSVRGVVVASAPVTIDVSPPVASGLPRIVGSATTWNLGMPVAIRYTATTIRDLAGTVVRRGGGALANVEVNIVGELPNIATVTAGVAIAVDGELRQSATTNAGGALPTLRAPASAVLSAVVVPAPGDFAVSALDLAGGVPATIDAPAMVPVTTKTRGSNNGLLGGVTMDAIPVPPLALANAPVIRAVSNASGNITTSFAAGGRYRLVFTDPANFNAQLKVASTVTAATIPASNTLQRATRVTAEVRGTSSIRRASVQVLCATCTGLDRSRPIAEGVTGIDGKFTLAVPDPKP